MRTLYTDLCQDALESAHRPHWVDTTVLLEPGDEHVFPRTGLLNGLYRLLLVPECSVNSGHGNGGNIAPVSLRLLQALENVDRLGRRACPSMSIRNLGQGPVTQASFHITSLFTS